MSVSELKAEVCNLTLIIYVGPCCKLTEVAMSQFTCVLSQKANGLRRALGSRQGYLLLFRIWLHLPFHGPSLEVLWRVFQFAGGTGLLKNKKKSLLCSCLQFRIQHLSRWFDSSLATCCITLGFLWRLIFMLLERKSAGTGKKLQLSALKAFTLVN